MIDTSNNDRMTQIATRHIAVRKRREIRESIVGFEER